MSASFINIKRAAVEQSRRKLLQIELMIHQLSMHAAELDGVVGAEEARVGIFDRSISPTHATPRPLVSGAITCAAQSRT